MVSKWTTKMGSFFGSEAGSIATKHGLPMQLNRCTPSKTKFSLASRLACKPQCRGGSPVSCAARDTTRLR